jgi:hypothetical protein
MWSIAGLFSCCFAAVAIAAPLTSQALDPVFGLAYQPDKARFEPAPADLLTACPALQNARWTRKLWIYAQTETPDARVLVVGGFYVMRPAAGTAIETDPKGAMIETTPTDCKLLGPAREVFRYPDDLVAPPVLRALAADLVRRYRVAFGGTAAFKRILAQQRAEPAGARDAVLRDALSAGD